MKRLLQIIFCQSLLRVRGVVGWTRSGWTNNVCDNRVRTMVQTRTQKGIKLEATSPERKPAKKATTRKQTPVKKKSPKKSTASTTKKSPKKILEAALTSRQLSKIALENPYQDLKIPPEELRPSATLTTGQCFHWSVVEQDDTPVSPGMSAWGSHNSTEWVGVIKVPSTDHSAVVAIRETPDTTLFRVLEAPDHVDIRPVLEDYFQLKTPLMPLSQQWSQECQRLSQIAKCIPGVRVIQQDPFECLISFLCSSNNNIPRITQMLTAIRRTYGAPLLNISGTTLYSFPSLATLLEEATDADLRTKCGMGYRAKYLMQSIQLLEELGGESYLQTLRSIDDPTEVQEKLIQFHGVGRKVADCVALFSLCQINAIPVDTHVWNIAIRDYDEKGALREAKSLTPTIYKKVGDLFRSVFSQYAGWAHSLLFVAELPSFRAVLPEDLVEEMDKFRELEQAKKKAKREKKLANDDDSISSG